MEMNVEDSNNRRTFSKDEAALYDRQIRLWGAEAQRRLNQATVLVVGMNGLGAEVCKNIILGGVKAVTMMDHELVKELDFISQFLLKEDSLGENRATASLARAQELNPMVRVSAEPSKIEDKTDKYFENFDVICTVGVSKENNTRINMVSRNAGRKFFAADVFGFMSYIFTDLGDKHTYSEEVSSILKKKQEITLITASAKFVPFHDIFKVDWKSKPTKRTSAAVFGIYVLMEFMEQFSRKPLPEYREDDLSKILEIRNKLVQRLDLSEDKVPEALFSNIYGEFSPVCAITGGVLCQEVVKAISCSGCPIRNFFVFDPLKGTGFVEVLGFEA